MIWGNDKEIYLVNLKLSQQEKFLLYITSNSGFEIDYCCVISNTLLFSVLNITIENKEIYVFIALCVSHKCYICVDFIWSYL